MNKIFQTKFLLKAFSLVIFFSLPLSARWADFDDADSVVTFSKVSFNVKANGSYVMVSEKETEILKENAREDEGLFRTTFEPSMESFELIRAETRNGKKITPVDKNAIEIKPLASSGPGFEATAQVTIAYAEVNIGSKLYLKYKMIMKKPPYKGAFFQTRPFGWHENLKNLSIEFTSQVPLFYQVIDSENYFKVEATAQKIHLTLQKPLYKRATEEENVIYDAKSFPWFSVTTMQNWAQFPQSTIREYETVVTSALPAKFAQILAAAKAKPTSAEQINAVTSLLADALRYVGDWRAVRGSYIPRPLKEVAETGYGDCKDFASITGAILRKMGYATHVALIERGADSVFAPLTIAAPDFDHAILYVHKDGKDIWVDPTNSTSFAPNIFADIADRPVMVLHPQGAFIKRTPPLKSSDGEWATTAHFSFQSDDTINVSGRVAFDGRAAAGFTAADLFYSKANTDHSLISWLTDPANLLSWKVGDYSLKSRVISRFETDFEYREKWHPLITSAGAGYMTPAMNWLSYFRFKNSDRVGNLNLGYPLVVRRNYRMTGKRFVLSDEIKCEGKSEWTDYSRSIQLEDSELKISEWVDYKVKEISATSIATKEFADFQQRFIRCMQDVAIVFK